MKSQQVISLMLLLLLNSSLAGNATEQASVERSMSTSMVSTMNEQYLALLLKGLGSTKACDYNAAFESFSKATQLNPSKISAFYLRARLYEKLASEKAANTDDKKYDKLAEADFKNVCNLEPVELQELFYRGLAFAYLKDEINMKMDVLTALRKGYQPNEEELRKWREVSAPFEKVSL